MLKNNCACCGEKINNSPKHYEIYGNYCTRCCGRIETQIKYKSLMTERPNKIRDLNKWKIRKEKLEQSLKNYKVNPETLLKKQEEFKKWFSSVWRENQKNYKFF